MIEPLDPKIVAFVREGFDHLTRLACANQAGNVPEARDALRDLDILVENATHVVAAAGTARRAASRATRSSARLGVIDGGRP